MEAVALTPLDMLNFIGLPGLIFTIFGGGLYPAAMIAVVISLAA